MTIKYKEIFQFNRRTAHKDNIFWNKDETLVEYRVNISYEDCLTLSVDDPNKVKVTTVNVPLIVSVNKNN